MLQQAYMMVLSLLCVRLFDAAGYECIILMASQIWGTDLYFYMKFQTNSDDISDLHDVLVIFYSVERFNS